MQRELIFITWSAKNDKDQSWSWFITTGMYESSKQYILLKELNDNMFSKYFWHIYEIV